MVAINKDNDALDNFKQNLKMFMEADIENKYYYYDNLLYHLKEIPACLVTQMEYEAHRKETDSKTGDWSDYHIGYDYRLNIWIGFSEHGDPFVWNDDRDIVVAAIKEQF